VTALFLKLEKDLRQSFERYFILSLLSEGLADLKILTVDAAQIAQPEKDIAGSPSADQRRLFAKVRRVS